MRARRLLLVPLLLLGTSVPAAAQSGQRSGQQQQQAQPSDAETRLRLELLQRSLGFGGIFGPALQNWVNTPSQDNGCGPYTEYAACQAHRAGDDWAADRLQQHQSSGAEYDWYNR